MNASRRFVWPGSLALSILLGLLVVGVCLIVSPANSSLAQSSRGSHSLALSQPVSVTVTLAAATNTPAPAATAVISPTDSPTATASRTAEPTVTAATSAASPQPYAPTEPPVVTATAAAAPTAMATATMTPTATAPIAPAPRQKLRLAISKTLLGSDVVQVGQYLTFTIRVTNTGGVVVTELPLVDEYETSILQPALDRMSPAPSTTAAGVLSWNDLTDTFGDLAPGESVAVTAVFRAIRIDDEVINRARVEAAIGSGGEGGGPFDDESEGEVEGGRVIVEKALIESFIRLDTPVISFTISLRNDGYADIVRAPLVDTYHADLLSFAEASVPPDAHNPATGELRWNDLLASLGVARLRPQEVISFTTTYTVAGPIDDLIANSADAVDVVDEFGNRVDSPRRAEVRIRIRGAETTSTPTATETPFSEREEPRTTPTASATPTTPISATPTAATPTLAASATPGVTASVTPGSGGGAPTPTGPDTLPLTGAQGAKAVSPLLTLIAAAVVALAVGIALSRIQRRREES